MIELGPRWYPLRYHPDHDRILSSTARFILIQAGRRSGKTECGKRKLVMSLMEPTDTDRPKYFFAAPTRTQAKEIAWEDLKALTPPHWLAKPPSESDLKIVTKWGASLQVVGLDQPHRIEGSGYSGCMVDEMSDVKPGAITKSILPALADCNGWAIFSGVPKRSGVGAVAFNKMFDSAKESGHLEGSTDRVEAYHWKSSTVLTESQLSTFRAMMSTVDFAEQFEASRQNAGGTVFHAFGEHNIKPVKYDRTQPIIVGSDFNVSPMSWVLCHDKDGVLQQFDEIWINNTNTPATLTHLIGTYPDHRAGWIFCGDASARARKTSASLTDYIHIYNDNRFQNKRVLYPKANPRILDRISSCNALFKTASGEVRYHVDKSCHRTINDLQVRAFKEWTTVLDDSEDVGHISDALGYAIMITHPLKIPQTASPRVGTF